MHIFFFIYIYAAFEIPLFFNKFSKVKEIYWKIKQNLYTSINLDLKKNEFSQPLLFFYFKLTKIFLMYFHYLKKDIKKKLTKFLYANMILEFVVFMYDFKVNMYMLAIWYMN